ncbi:MAG: NUDIX hydrolase [Nocardiopsaceae bacterium]|nr:NUDIX hydrolase [Nocardiopsaceae bacterium]
MVVGTPTRSADLAAFALLIEDGRVLLVKQSYGLRLWALPGGMASPGETLEEAAVREVREETGLDVQLGGMVALADRGPLLLAVFTGAVRGGEMRPEPGEIEELRWFSIDELASVDGCSYALARELAAAGLAGDLGNLLLPSYVVGPGQARHRLFSASPLPADESQSRPV